MELTFDEHPKEVGQMEVVKEVGQKDDDDARARVGFISIHLFTHTKKKKI